MVDAKFLKPEHERTRGRFYRAGERAFDWLLGGYQAALTMVFRHPQLTLIVTLLTIALNIYLYVIVPKGFFPQEDTGRLMGSIVGDQDISFSAMRVKLAQFINIVKADPAVDNVVGFTGGGTANRGNMFVSLKPLTEGA